MRHPHAVGRGEVRFPEGLPLGQAEGVSRHHHLEGLREAEWGHDMARRRYLVGPA